MRKIVQNVYEQVIFCFQEYVKDMDVTELKRYMRGLMIAVRKVHKFNIIHRDVKPSNFLYDRKRGKYLLVDFGLAQEYKPHVEQSIEERSALPDVQSVKRKRGDEVRFRLEYFLESWKLN